MASCHCGSLVQHDLMELSVKGPNNCQPTSSGTVTHTYEHVCTKHNEDRLLKILSYFLLLARFSPSRTHRNGKSTYVQIGSGKAKTDGDERSRAQSTFSEIKG